MILALENAFASRSWSVAGATNVPGIITDSGGETDAKASRIQCQSRTEHSEMNDKKLDVLKVGNRFFWFIT